MTPDETFEHRRIAYRQAGYAVAAAMQARSFGALSIAPMERAVTQAFEPRKPGREPMHVDLQSKARHRIELEVVALWAGLLSETNACFEGETPPEGWGPGYQRILELGDRVTSSPEENRAFAGWLRCRAATLLTLGDVQGMVEETAARVLNQGVLSSQEVRAILGRQGKEARQRRGFFGLGRS